MKSYLIRIKFCIGGGGGGGRVGVADYEFELNIQKFKMPDLIWLIKIWKVT